YAGRLIEVVGLKEKRLGDMAFSDKHANFLVNFADGSYRDAVTLIEEAERLVFKEFNIKLEREIIVLNNNNYKIN
ncbi:MAG: UDP-N-acetylmuramate dehydrogenase, partial [Campylobacterota bacterium]|nr:UDP-N-acetylmuramate dehydrogenase [Campylobacterota bacterium]